MSAPSSSTDAAANGGFTAMPGNGMLTMQNVVTMPVSFDLHVVARRHAARRARAARRHVHLRALGAPLADDLPSAAAPQEASLRRARREL